VKNNRNFSIFAVWDEKSYNSLYKTANPGFYLMVLAKVLQDGLRISFQAKVLKKTA